MIMVRDNIDTKHLTVSDKVRENGDELHVKVEDDVIIVVTRAFGPNGDSLVGLSDVTFDGYPAVTLKLRCEGREGLVHLSPFHGDNRKAGMTDIPMGCACELFCPVSGKPLDVIGQNEDSGAVFHAIYLTPKLSRGDMVVISNVWGDYSSRIIDGFDLISDWAHREDTLN